MNGWTFWAVTPPLSSDGMALRELYIVAGDDKAEATAALAARFGEEIEITVAGPASARTIELLKLKKGEVHNVFA